MASVASSTVATSLQRCPVGCFEQACRSQSSGVKRSPKKHCSSLSVSAHITMSTLQTSKHQATRTLLRVAGPAIAFVALVFITIGAIDFFSSFGGFGPPKRFWCFFVGLPLLFVGMVVSMFGYMGAVARYAAAEQVPVATDAVNELADGTRDAVKTVARAVAEGVKEGMTEEN